MAVHIIKDSIPFNDTSTSTLLFIPKNLNNKNSLAVFTHGYTSHKASLLSWAFRLCEEGVPTLLFDLPGHLLGCSPELANFEDFSSGAHTLFFESYKALQRLTGISEGRVILGGHSLGALLSLKSLCFFKNYKTTHICVGLGMSSSHEGHIYETPLYKKTMALRAELVSKAIEPSSVFPWIRQEKKTLKFNGRHIYLLCGKDDIVVGEGGAENLKIFLEKQGNVVVLEMPCRLPHHVPERASSYIKTFLQKEALL